MKKIVEFLFSDLEKPYTCLWIDFGPFDKQVRNKVITPCACNKIVDCCRRTLINDEEELIFFVGQCKKCGKIYYGIEE